MRVFFAVTFVVLIGLSLLAWSIRPNVAEPGKTALTWVSDDNPARREQISLFNRLHKDLTLRLDPNNTGMEKVIVQSLAGVGPDLFDCYDTFQLSAYVKSGIAWDVTDELAKLGLDPAKQTWKAVQADSIYEGRAYGFGNNVGADAVWFNKSIFDREGIPYPKGPWRWPEFIKLAQRLTHRDANGRATQFGFMCEWWQWLHFVYQFGGRVYSEDGTRCVVDSPETVAAVQLLYDLIYKYKVMPSPVEEAAMATQGGWGSGTITRFGADKGAMALGGRWWLCTLRDYKGLRLGVVECPYSVKRVFRGYGKGTLINKNSPHRQEALKFLIYQAGRDYNQLISDQADALGPVVKFAYEPRYLMNPKHPEEDYNVVWRDALERATPDQYSPFINGQVALRLLNKQLDLVKNNQKTAKEAMRDAALQLNREIARGLEQDPELARRYRETTGRTAPGGAQ
ncbi:MAG: extracellular solute-binding protein [Armatimonadetes bacterium]|nr:extracellular solute-binding protein [Armatimonadota bacterium]